MGIAETLDGNINDIIRRLERTLASINAQIIALVPDTADKKAAQAAALDARAQVAQALGAFDAEVDALVSDYVAAVQLARDNFGLDETFTSSDARLLDAMIQDTAQELKAAGLAAASQVSEVIYMGAIAGATKADMIEQVRQLLLGGTDKRGRSLAAHAGTIAETRYMQVFATATKQLADNAGVDKFRYDGTLVADSRPWCVQHLGQVLTKKEIDAWRNKEWEGKAPGDPFVTRGGWRCRHFWTAIID